MFLLRCGRAKVEGGLFYKEKKRRGVNVDGDQEDRRRFELKRTHSIRRMHTLGASRIE